MNKKPLDLNGLTMDEIDFSSVRGCIKEYDQTERQYRDKYGDDWWDHYAFDTGHHEGVRSKSHRDVDKDWDEETINEAIYNGHRPCVSGHPQIIYQIDKKYWEKMKRLFGPFYKKYVRHEPNNPKINKALLKDALRSGMWKELPEGLHEEYHKMAGK